MLDLSGFQRQMWGGFLFPVGVPHASGAWHGICTLFCAFSCPSFPPVDSLVGQLDSQPHLPLLLFLVWHLYI